MNKFGIRRVSLMPGRNFRRKLIVQSRIYGWTEIGKKCTLKILIPLLMIVIGGVLIIIRVSPMISGLAMADATDIMRDLIGAAITEVLSTGEFDYSELVTLEKGADGTVAALVTNMQKINILQTKVAETVLNNIDQLGDIVIRIPLGSITGISLLSGTGPKLNVKLLSITSVDTTFSDAFTSAGINQTRHQIIMNVSIEVGVVLPTETPCDVVTMSVVVAETVIVGTVPQTYADFN